MKFNENLRNLRKIKKLSQTDLAKYCHISQNTVSNYEAGNREPEIQILILLAQALNVSLDLLIIGDDDKIYISREEYEELKCAKKAFDKLENCLNAIEERKETFSNSTINADNNNGTIVIGNNNFIEKK